jgi:hypothetical protein
MSAERTAGAPIVRAGLFELVDSAGEVVARLGIWPYTGLEGDDVVGLEFLSDPGVSLIAGRHGAQLTFEIGGNQVLIVEAMTAAAGRAGGAAITLCDRDGAPVATCRVDADGHLDIELGSRT